MKGFTLLYSVIFVAASLAVGVGLSNLIIGQIQLSGFGRDSQLAFYAADTGAECAIYWDRAEEAFATSSENVLTCAGQEQTVGGGETSVFNLSFDNGSCANVTVDKSSEIETVITSLGRSPCEGRRVERGLEVRY